MPNTSVFVHYLKGQGMECRLLNVMPTKLKNGILNLKFLEALNGFVPNIKTKTKFSLFKCLLDCD